MKLCMDESMSYQPSALSNQVIRKSRKLWASCIVAKSMTWHDMTCISNKFDVLVLFTIKWNEHLAIEETSLFVNLLLKSVIILKPQYWWIWMNFHQSFERCSSPHSRKQPQYLLRITWKGKLRVGNEWSLEGAMYILGGIPTYVLFFCCCKFLLNIDGFRQNNTQVFLNL